MSDNVRPLLPGCPQCGAIVGRKGHICRARAETPNWDPTNFPVTDPERVREHVAAVRQALADHRPPEAAPAASTSILSDHVLTRTNNRRVGDSSPTEGSGGAVT